MSKSNGQHKHGNHNAVDAFHFPLHFLASTGDSCVWPRKRGQKLYKRIEKNLIKCFGSFRQNIETILNSFGIGCD